MARSTRNSRRRWRSAPTSLPRLARRGERRDFPLNPAWCGHLFNKRESVRGRVVGWLEDKIKSYRAMNFGERHVKYLELLISPSPDADKIRRWFKKNARQNIGSDLARSSGQNCEDWEYEIWFLSTKFSGFYPLDAWEITPAERRRSHAHHVSRLCHELADTLEEEPSPYYYPVLRFFDPERAIDIIRALEEPTAKALLGGTGYSLDWRDGYTRTGPPACWFADGNPAYFEPSDNLERRFSFKAQNFPSMLRRLADYAEACIEKPKRDQRPNFPNRDARAFARELANHFARFFDCRPLEVIASCVALMFPDLDPPPQKDLVSGWLDIR